MSRSANQHMKLFYIVDYLTQQSNYEHPVRTADIIEMLARNNIKAERKTIYHDIQALVEYGFDIVYKKKSPSGFYMASGVFQIPELKFLVDAVQASKFITARKSQELIEKLSRFVSIYDAGQFKRQVYIADRVKSFNETVYIGIDQLHEAISSKVKITFLYCEWTLSKELRSRHGSYRYTVSPYAMIWDDENYYMIGYDHDAEKIKHFRVDKMLEIHITEETRCDDKIFEKINLATYSRQTFGMFGGRSEKVTLSCKNQLVGVILDRFGKEVILIKETNSIFRVTVTVTVSPQFFGWLASFGGDIHITGPTNTVEEYKAFLKKVLGSLL